MTADTSDTSPSWLQLKSIALHDENEALQLWPDGTGEEYVAARLDLARAERELREQVLAVARLHRELRTSFNADLHVESSRGGQWPAVSVLVRDGDRVRHVLTQSAEYPGSVGGGNGGIDLLSPVWNVLDLLPEGRGDWLPDNGYP